MVYKNFCIKANHFTLTTTSVAKKHFFMNLVIFRKNYCIFFVLGLNGFSVEKLTEAKSIQKT